MLGPSLRMRKKLEYPPPLLERGSNFDNVFLVDEGREDPSTTISGPSKARQRNAIYGPSSARQLNAIIKWRFAGVPMMAQH